MIFGKNLTGRLPIFAAVMIGKKVRRISRISRYIVYKETLVDRKEQLCSFLGSFIGMGLIAFVQSKVVHTTDSFLMIGSFGASSVLIFAAVQSPLSQPRNLIGGHLLSAFIGVTISKLLPEIIWLAAPLSVSLSIVVMQMTKTLHPPGGATALLAVIGSEKIKALGYFYIVSPVMIGVLILFLTAIVFNNLTPNRKYPTDKRFTKSVKNILRKRRKAAVAKTSSTTKVSAVYIDEKVEA